MHCRCACLALLLLAAPLRANGVVVLANHAERDVTCTVTTLAGPPQTQSIARNDLVVLHVAGATTVSYLNSGKVRTVRMREGSAYFFHGASDAIRCELILDTVDAGRAGGDGEGVIDAPPLLRLPIKLLADDADPGVQAVWEPRLRRRIGLASAVLEKVCGVHLQIVAVESWSPARDIKEFPELIRDFERKVTPRPGRLAIGFSSVRVPLNRKSPYLGGTRGALHSHILIREWFPPTESERLEVLLHELGHFLGATHTIDTQSVMRARVGDGQATRKDFHVGFDPLAALAMNVVARSLTNKPARALGALPEPSRKQLAIIYKEIARALPDDPSVTNFQALLEDVPQAPPEVKAAAAGDPLIAGGRSVVKAIVESADAARKQGLTDERLIEHYVRAGAAAASRQPESERVPAFLLGLAVALDTTDQFRNAATTKALWRNLETDDDRAERLKVIGQPALFGQPTRARRFLAAAVLTNIAGSGAAEPTGIVRDLFGTGTAGTFSFADLALDCSGSAFALTLADNPKRLADLAGSFTIGDFVLRPDGLEDGIAPSDFAQRFGSFSDARFKERETDLRRRVTELAGYRK